MFVKISGGFDTFKERYPEWCEGSNQICNDSNTTTGNNTDPNDGGGELMGLRSLRISSTPTTTTARAYSDSDSDSTCDSIGKVLEFKNRKIIFLLSSTYQNL